MSKNAIEAGQGGIKVIQPDLYVVSGLAVPDFLPRGRQDVLVGLVHEGVQQQQGVMGPVTRRGVRKDIAEGNAVVVAQTVEGVDMPIFEAVAFTKPAKRDPKVQEVRTVLGLHPGRSIEAVPEALREAVSLAATRKPEHGIQALVAESNGRAQRRFIKLGGEEIGRRDSDYVHEGGDKRKPPVKMVIFNLDNI
jgi:hypothetical protein